MPFNEEASAQSFQKVLSQWRTGHHDDNETQSLHAAKSGTVFFLNKVNAVMYVGECFAYVLL